MLTYFCHLGAINLFMPQLHREVPNACFTSIQGFPTAPLLAPRGGQDTALPWQAMLCPVGCLWCLPTKGQERLAAVATRSVLAKCPPGEGEVSPSENHCINS